jgi:hypothetical protein
VSVNLTWQAEVPAVAAVCLVTSAGPAFRSHTMGGLVDVVEVRLMVTCIGTSVELVTQLRAKAAEALIGRDRSSWAFHAPLNVAGMVVVRRELSEDRLPAVSQGGGWVNAVLPVTLHLQSAS